MSGGSYDYVYQRIDDICIQSSGDPKTNALRRGFQRLLSKVAKAMHDIEWVDSSDYGPGEEISALEAVVRPQDVLDSAIEQAEKARVQLEFALRLAGR